ncbi:D-tyrosyl-tRNA(Tyr) deacylase [bacterium]|nr:MAG: D-tyrosyl-tRNA(Tyr) deacylase [bacterium]
MKAIVQRVASARVEVEGRSVGEIGKGLLVLIAVGREDDEAALRKAAERVANLRIFSDADGKMNLSVREIEGAVLAVSNFTVLGDTRQRRPFFGASASGDTAQPLFEGFVSHLRTLVSQVETGEFGADMRVSLVNDGPVTVVVE